MKRINQPRGSLALREYAPRSAAAARPSGEIKRGQASCFPLLLVRCARRSLAHRTSRSQSSFQTGRAAWIATDPIHQRRLTPLILHIRSRTAPRAPGACCMSRPFLPLQVPTYRPPRKTPLDRQQETTPNVGRWTFGVGQAVASSNGSRAPIAVGCFTDSLWAP
jgi:hypothetical protein